MPKIRALRQIHDVNAHLAMQNVSAANAPRAVYDAAHMAVVVATEMMWPSLLELSRKIKDGPYEQNGWRLRSHPAPRPWDEDFVLEEVGGQGGYLFNIRLRPRKTDEALEELNDLMRPAEAALGVIVDRDERDLARKESILNPSAEILNIAEDPKSYLPQAECTEIEHLVCCAFSKDGVSPSGFDDEMKTPFELATVTAIGQDYYGYMPGRVFAVRPDGLLDFDDHPDVPLSRSIEDIGASLSVLSTIGAMLSGLDLARSVTERAADLGRVSYRHYWSDERTPLLELAAVSVYRDGGVIGERTTSEILQVWHHACDAIVSASAVPLSSTIRLLRERGHLDSENAYAAYGDVLHLEDTAPDQGVLFVTTSHNSYRIDFTTDDDGIVLELDVSIIAADRDATSADDPGFLGSYRLSPDGGIRSSAVSEQGFFRGNSMRALNDVTQSIEMTAEALAEDRTSLHMFAH